MARHRQPFINDYHYIQTWTIAANRATAANPTVDPPPPNLIHAYGRPACPACWDTGLCPECNGRYPQYCPSRCTDGTCTCTAGRNRRAAYKKSLKDYGLT